MRFIESLPIIEEKLPVCPDGTDISVAYYLFSKFEDIDANEHLVRNYAYEAVYAYKQLLTCTNIAECGRVRFFVDRRCEPVMRPCFEQVGLDTLIEIIDVPKGVRLSGYIPQLSHPSLDPCRYRFHNDTDLWWFCSDPNQQIFDWKAYCTFLDKADNDCFFGQPIEKPDWVYQINYSQFALNEEAQQKALATLQQIFGPRIPDIFHKIAYQQNNVLRKENQLSNLRCYGGWFVGVRADSNAIWYINNLYQKYEECLGDDEGLFSILFHLHPEIKQYPALQGHHEPLPEQIQHAYLLNFKELQGVGVINVGSQEFYMEEHKQEREDLRTFLLDMSTPKVVDTDVDLEVHPHHLNTFGRHIVGTYALDADSQPFPLLTHTDRNHATMFGFPAAFPPIQDFIPYNQKPAARLALFYCLFHHPVFAIHDLHVYAKSMTYALKMLMKNTNFFEHGNIYLFIDERIMSVVLPYCKAANIEEIVVPFKSDKNIQYAAYIPCFWHEVMKDIPIRIYMDVDMWWINMHDDTKFDYRNLIEELLNGEADVFGYSVPKNTDTIQQDLYNRSIYGNDTHTEKTKQWMVETFGTQSLTEDIRAISGCHNGVRNGETLQRLKDFYQETGEFIRDDEALWAIFLSKNPDIQIKEITDLIHGVGFRHEDIKHHDKSQIAHVGTYMFEHFFAKPYAKQVYQHCIEP